MRGDVPVEMDVMVREPVRMTISESSLLRGGRARLEDVGRGLEV